MTETGGAKRDEADLGKLLRLYQMGDAGAAAALIRVVSPMLLRFCRSQGDLPDDIDDVLQEIWLRIHRARHTYRPEAAAVPWLYGIARYARLDARRRRQRFRSREVQINAVPETTASEPVGRQFAFADLIADLPPAQRDVLVMLKTCGMTLEEVARATSSTVGAVKQRAYRAYARLRQALKESIGERQS
jgi:RNA polymerase sigma-70 factor (ECF subfamily)